MMMFVKCCWRNLLKEILQNNVFINQPKESSIPEINVLKWPVIGALRSAKENIHGYCRTCKTEECYGCRANAYHIKGCIFHEDPTCWIANPNGKPPDFK